MRVVCISEYPSEEQIKRLGKNFDRNQSFGLVVGQEYLVLGLWFAVNSHYGTGVVVEYFDGDHLLGAPLCLFEVKNPGSSCFWEARKWKEDDSLTLWPCLFYEEYFHDRLSDYEPEPRAKFKEVYDLMEREDLGLLGPKEQPRNREA